MVQQRIGFPIIAVTVGASRSMESSGPEWSGRPGVPAPAMTWSRYRGRSTTPRVEVDTIALVGRHWWMRSEDFHCQAPNLTHPGNLAQSVPQTCRSTGLRSLNAHSPVYAKLRPTPVYSNPSASMRAASSAFLPSNTNRGGRIPRAMASQSALVISLHSVISATA